MGAVVPAIFSMLSGSMYSLAAPSAHQTIGANIAGTAWTLRTPGWLDTAQTWAATQNFNADTATNAQIWKTSLTRTGGTPAGSSFAASFAVGSTAQGPNSTDNAVYSEGFNINSTGQVATAGKVAIRWNFEENFYNASLSKYTVEWNFPSFYTTAGTEIRPFGGYAAHDGSTVALGVNATLFSIEDLSGNQYLEFSSSLNNFKKAARFCTQGDTTHYTSIVQSGSNGQIVQVGGGDLFMGNGTSHVRTNGFTVYTGTTGIDWNTGAASFFSTFSGAKIRMYSDAGTTQKLKFDGADGSATILGQVTVGSTSGASMIYMANASSSIEYFGKWYLYINGNNFYVRDLTNSRQHLEFNPGASSTAAALKVNARMVVSGAADDGSTGFMLANGMDLQDCNIKLGTTTGTKIGTATTQKIGFWNVTPVVQQVLATGAGATADNIITLLQTLGLCKQS